MSPRLTLPDGVLGMAGRGADWAAWVDRLPGLVRDLIAEWELEPDGLMMHGFVALVVPVRTAQGIEAVLKVSFPDEESQHEHLALRHWGGRGAVRLQRADPRRRAMVLDRLGPGRLSEAWDVEACEVVGGLYGLLHVPAPPQLRLLTSYVERWTAQLAALPREAPLPHRLVEQAVALGRDFVTDPASTGTLVHADLHYDNVLAASGGWAAIDPKPVSGDPHFEPAPMLCNRFEELEVPGGGSVRDGLRRRFHTLVDTAGLDEDRARDWVVVRMLHYCLWAVQEDPGLAHVATSERITRCVAAAKAVSG